MKYLGIDFGLRRIGLSTSDGILASPFKIIEVKNFKDAVSRVQKIIDDEQFDRVVVGLPQGKMGKIVLWFVAALRKNKIVSTGNKRDHAG